MAKSPNRLSASEAVLRMAQKRLKARDLVEACLDRIEAREGQVHAWEALDPDGARKRADVLDKRSRPTGPLHGIPLAVKDIIATKTMPTTCGSPIYRDHVVGKDADCVTRLVKAGAIVLGKAVTTEFAGGHAGKTHNPHNLRHTPAGSSSGSAAAVADFMVPVGYGTQTAGSVIRPGAFNGVVAYKGSYGWADMTGIKAYAPFLDTLGFFAREANDLALIRAAYGHAPADPIPGPPARPPRIGLIRTPWWDIAEPYNRKNIEEAARTLRAAGARVREWQAPDNWANLMQAQHRIMTKEATQSYAKERARSSHLFSPIMHGVMEEGDAVSRKQYADAKKRRRTALAQLDDAWTRFDILLAPSAKGEAPSGLGNTGDPIFNRFWTLLGTPCIALPFNTGPFGLPLSVQLVGARGTDDQLIAWARWVERKLS
ncbi:amidase [Reyranella soli]|uniref:Amidase n=1 Tax=Reyranella soli TaxID=1230389 RepID=A0A512NK48_9HYPH|nr:amidase [Reyranella soli]GEP59317.1 amidase [Reyranella soli]